jgi:ubiquinone/menaquinone biosynthesis C-methylase UbiE
VAVEWLPELFGSGAGYVAGAILAALTVLVLAAFRQGRTIQFWPPKIGPKPPGRAVAGGKTRRRGHVAAPDDKQLASFLPAPVATATRMFEVRDAAQFYREIASHYDQRNSDRLLATHMEVITRIDHARKGKPALQVLDLGGGTGRNVATYFFNDNHISWTYVDYCPAMIEQLQEHLTGRRLYEHLSVHLDDINRIHLRLQPASYDVILLNLVLSSMPQPPDFGRIAALLAPGGRLIVADINPAYTQAHPYYQAPAADGTQIALRTRPVQPLEVAIHATEAGLRLSEMAEIGSGEISYSFIATFLNPGGPDDGPGAQAA